MVLNPWLLLGPLGMMVVGILAVVLWKSRYKISLKFFIFGGVLWVAAIIPKIIMDGTVTPPFYLWCVSRFGVFWGVVLLGAYVGLRTGFFECGSAYLGFAWLLRRRVPQSGGTVVSRSVSYMEAVAIGVGFGAFEAILLALPSLAQMAYIFLDPSLLSLLPPDQALLLEEQLGQPTWVALAAVWERVFAILAHIFATVLVYLAVAHRRPILLGGAAAYKSLLDAPIPIFQTMLASSPYYIVITEAFVGIMGLIGLLGMLNMGKITSKGGNVIRNKQ
ncbi:MAG: YhfC family glutamic-type intramembrane protease [Candidatus Verstraetearchaeota archaeon]|nr:YhfC family glutamic-type intramembrane protease [Candidatus Verstraetearchaeota archaeon]